MDCCVCFSQVHKKKHFNCGHWVCNDCFTKCRSPVPKKLRCPMCRAEEYFICNNTICNNTICNWLVCVIVIIIIALKDIRLLMHACCCLLYFVVVR